MEASLQELVSAYWRQELRKRFQGPKAEEPTKRKGRQMACPTCDHTMSRLGCQYSECAGTWACPRCGTLKVGHEDGRFDIIRPVLVDRCRDYEKILDGAKVLTAIQPWITLGIAESIHTPEERPAVEEKEQKRGR